MLTMFKKIMRFAGSERREINKSIAVSFIYSLFKMLEIVAIYLMIIAIIDGRSDNQPIFLSIGLMLVSIVGCTITKYFSQLQQTHAVIK